MRNADKRCIHRCTQTHTLKKCSFLKIGNNSFSVNFTHFWEKTHLLAFELLFVCSSWRVYMHIKFDILNKRLESYKKLSIFGKWAMQNNLDELEATKIKWKNWNNITWVNVKLFILIKCIFSSWVIFILVF